MPDIPRYCCEDLCYLTFHPHRYGRKLIYEHWNERRFKKASTRKYLITRCTRFSSVTFWLFTLVQRLQLKRSQYLHKLQLQSYFLEQGGLIIFSSRENSDHSPSITARILLQFREVIKASVQLKLKIVCTIERFFCFCSNAVFLSGNWHLKVPMQSSC